MTNLKFGKNKPCLLKDNIKKNTNSLTHLYDLQGAPELQAVSTFGKNNKSSIDYGAEFKTINRQTPYYERNIKVRVSPPWLAKEQEKTFLNYTKMLNREPVKTYKDLELSPIPDQKQETYEPIIYTMEDPNYNLGKNIGVNHIEGFGKIMNNSWFLILTIVLIISFILFK